MGTHTNVIDESKTPFDSNSAQAVLEGRGWAIVGERNGEPCVFGRYASKGAATRAFNRFHKKPDDATALAGAFGGVLHETARDNPRLVPKINMEHGPQRNREMVKLKPGDRIKDNDLRKPNRVLAVRTVISSRAIVAETSKGRLVIILRHKIYEDEVPGSIGYMLLKDEQ